jgi:hypothetical protein
MLRVWSIGTNRDARNKSINVADGSCAVQLVRRDRFRHYSHWEQGPALLLLLSSTCTIPMSATPDHLQPNPHLECSRPGSRLADIISQAHSGWDSSACSEDSYATTNQAGARPTETFLQFQQLWLVLPPTYEAIRPMAIRHMAIHWQFAILTTFNVRCNLRHQIPPTILSPRTEHTHS